MPTLLRYSERKLTILSKLFRRRVSVALVDLRLIKSIRVCNLTAVCSVVLGAGCGNSAISVLDISTQSSSIQQQARTFSHVLHLSITTTPAASTLECQSCHKVDSHSDYQVIRPRNK